MLLLLLIYAHLANSMQQFVLQSDWNVHLSSTWDVLGPFPIHAREQHYLSPSFPLNLSEPIDYNKSWPSAYADGGTVSWTTAIQSPDDKLQVSFPDIRWSSLRSTEGWAALQHHAVLHSSITVYPPKTPYNPHPPPHLRVNLLQGSYFTIIPADKSHVPQWYAGNVYAMERAIPKSISLPSDPSLTAPTKYDLFISGDYEIRLFGDPHGVPVQSITISVDIEETTETFVREPTQDVICNFVRGFAFGDAIGFGLRSVSGWWTVKSVKSTGQASESLKLSLLRPIRLAPSQTRIIPIQLNQTAAISPDITALHMHVVVSSNSDPDVSAEDQLITVTLPLKHLPLWSADRHDAILATYLFARSVPTFFAVIPPKYENNEKLRSPVLALHGAGVDIVAQSFWADAMPRRNHSWFVLPSGRTSWGLDWHGPSCTDAWSSLDALVSILDSNTVWHPWKLRHGMPAVVIGHSNGGQGTWYIASRYPDRVLAAIPAAAYIKSQAYIPLAFSRSAHYIDPTLRAILEASLTPDDNDLFTTNLVDKPVLAIHGGDDDNVPVWHSRELVSTLQTWSPRANVSYHEDLGQKHWYSSVFRNDEVERFLDRVLIQPALPPQSFTLTVVIPSESGPLHGWRIEILHVPGRLARIHVEVVDDGTVLVKTSNVRWFSINTSIFPVRSLRIDNIHLEIPSASEDIVRFEAAEAKIWKLHSKYFPGIQSHGRMQNILQSSGPLLLVIPDETHPQEMSVALRIAHDLNTYHKLDANIIISSEAVPENLNQGNIIAVGNEASAYMAGLISTKAHEHLTPVLDSPGLGILVLHPHPTLPGGRMVFMQSTDSAGLERAARLFPIRTGVAVPDWVIVGPEADQVGASGIAGAGVWGNGYTWNDAMSWTF